MPDQRSPTDGSASPARECARAIIDLEERAGDDRKLFARGTIPIVQRLLARPDLLALGVPRTTVHADVGHFLYYDHDLTIVTSQLHVGAKIPVHAHRTWEALGVYRGAIEHTLYRVIGHEPSKLTAPNLEPSSADVQALETRVLNASEVVVLDAEDDAHGWTAISPDTVIVVLGGIAPPHRYFEPAT